MNCLSHVMHRWVSCLVNNQVNGFSLKEAVFCKRAIRHFYPCGKSSNNNVGLDGRDKREVPY